MVREGLLIGVIGSLVGAVVGLLTAIGITSAGVAGRFVPDLPYSFAGTELLLPVIAVALTTVAASWVGSRRVLTVSPMEATGASHATSLDEQGGGRGRNIAALVLFLVGDAVLVLAVLIGLVSPYGVFVGVLGGVLSFSGVVLGANVVMPRALRIIGRAFGLSAAARLARENAVRYPERSARTTIGLVIAVTLITTFAVTLSSYVGIITAGAENEPELYEGTAQVLRITVIVFSILMGFSALIAAVGMVNNLSLNVVQRTRELGMLRALGFTARQVRRMILIESAQLSAAAAIVGLLLGIFYGWVGAQSLIGGIAGSPGIVVPVVPVVLLAVVVGAAAVLAAAASVSPSRRATRLSPVAALAAE